MILTTGNTAQIVVQSTSDKKTNLGCGVFQSEMPRWHSIKLGCVAFRIKKPTSRPQEKIKMTMIFEVLSWVTLARGHTVDNVEIR